jgi:hypothetical protein
MMSQKSLASRRLRTNQRYNLEQTANISWSMQQQDIFLPDHEELLTQAHEGSYPLTDWCQFGSCWSKRALTHRRNRV